ncbi:LamG-like jellyroll fold domain-containing protein [Aquimarina sp. 2201CG1-2-11]|uniref:LamG-like jellyroll fold domain-containing protein n=1 Tax=Aquimarina discodermiae TaxID=3231043 RepID=UPI0034633E94
MKRILLSICLGLMANWLWAQSNPQVVTGATTLQEKDYNNDGDNVTLQVGTSQYYFDYSLPISGELDGHLSSRFPWDVLYMNDTFTEQTFDVSKGYYGDKIQLDWSIGANKEEIENILIYRRPYVGTTSEYFQFEDGEYIPHESFGAPITTLSNDDFQYIDYYVEGGLLYEYLVYAKGVSALAERYTSYITGVGYRNPTAVVSGNISFEGGNPVKDVVVRAEPQGAELNIGSSIVISDQGKLNVRYLNKKITTETTFQSWIRIQDPSDFNWLTLQYRDLVNGDILSSKVKANVVLDEENGEKTLKIKVSGVNAGSGEYSVTLKKYYPTGDVDGRGDDILKPISEITSNFIHLSLILTAGNTPKLFLNGRQLNNELIGTIAEAQEKELDSTQRKIPELSIIGNYTYPSDKEFNSLLIADQMDGVIDEIRLWQRPLDERTIRQDFKRYLNGTETGLLMYLRANEGQGEYVYDLSAKGYDFNKNNALLVHANWTSNATDRPTTNQLGVLGVTDENGNYVIAAIPYSGAGESYTITPAYGVHQFKPNQQLIFLGESAQIVNKIDFKDVSSFIFRGRARMDVYGTFEPIKNNDGKIELPNVTQVKESGYNEYSVTINNTERTYQKGDYQEGKNPNTIVDMPNVGIEGANIYIDGNIVIGSDNRPVTTDKDGGFVINVPIGNHYIEVKKDRHHFTYGGRFPMTVEDALAQEERINGAPLTTAEITYIRDNHNIEFDFFEHQEQSVTFLDQTKVTLVGKVVGGSIEAEKPIGFGSDGYVEHVFNPQTPEERTEAVSAKNNIGVATIKLSHEAGDLLINTNETSGEYRIAIAPLQYTIEKTSTSDGVSIVNDTDNISNTFLNANEILDLRTVPVTKTSTFSLGEGVDPLVSGPYHFEKSFVYRSAPQLYVTRQTSTEQVPVDGDLYSTKGVQLNGKDLFIYEQFQKYFIDFETYELYKNYDKGITGVESKVAITDGDFIITNNLALDGSEKITINQNDKSKSTYSFEAGIPSISKPFLRTLSINYRVNGIDTPANNYNDEGLILGGKSDGSQTFVTAAPDVPDIILRDPPGSNSFASIEKGESISYTAESSFNSTGGVSSSLQWKIGCTFSVGGGLAGPVIETETTNSLTGGISVTTSSSVGTSLNKTYTFNETISTSDDPEYVGADGDLFIGNSKNYFYGSYDNIQVNTSKLPDSNSLELHFKDIKGNDVPLFISKQKAMYFVEKPSETFFVYSQKHIIETLIPELEAIVYSIENNTFDPKNPPKLSKDEYERQINLWKETVLNNEITKYRTLKERGKYKEGLTATLEAQESILEREIEKSDLAPGGELNGEKQLKEKLEDLSQLKTLLENRFEENISFDAGVGELSKHIESTTIVGKTTEYNITIDESLALELGFTINKAGFISTISAIATQEINGGVKAEKTNTSIISYTLKDNDEANMLSVDVVNAFDGDGPVFSTIGGRTSCPYEGISSSLFFDEKEYKKIPEKYHEEMREYNDYVKSKSAYEICELNKENGATTDCTEPDVVNKPDFYKVDFSKFKGGFELNYATQRVEIPLISVKKANMTNIPETGIAEFELILENNSVSETDADFKLKIDNTTNPYNAKMNVGFGGEIVHVPYGQKVPFLLTLEKSASDQFDYHDIDIILESLCDKYNVNDRVSISASFVPSCSKVVVAKPFDNWVVNNADIFNLDGSTNAVTVELSEFNTSFNSFKKIELQYRKSTASSWNRLHTYYKSPFTTVEGDAVDYLATAIENGEDKNSSITEATLSYAFDIAGLELSDGRYEIRAITSCTDGTQYISETILGTVDLQRPQQFGTPSPTDGILHAGEDLRLQFSEPIYYNPAISKIEIVAETNDLPVSHGVSAYFNGSENTVVIDKTNVVSGDYSIEFWMNNSTIGDATIMHQENGFDLRLVNGELVWTLGGQTIQQGIISDDLFHHYTLSYHSEKGELRIYEDSNELIVKTVGALEFTNKEKLTIGGNNFSGNLHDLRMWTKSISLSESAANMYTKFSGSERNLVGYWLLNEGQGTIAKDLARYIHATMNASWDIKPKTNAYGFNNDQYIELNLSDFSEYGAAKQIHDEMDITLSFWVKTDKKKVATIFSNGRGTTEDFVQSNGKRNKWAIELDTEGLLVFKNEGLSYQLSNRSIADNSWHHIAMVVNRIGALKTYIDTALVSSYPTKDIGGISGNTFWIGARGFTHPNSTTTVDQFFTGKIDEVRLWNTARSIEQIRRDSGYEISPTTLGLILYANMNRPELPNGKGPRYYHALSNNTTPAVNSVLSTGLPNYSEDAPKLKPKRDLLSFDVRHVINGDEMIITPEISNWAVLEGQILDITVDRMFDTVENRQASPVTWTAFVERNEVSWYVAENEDVLDIEKFVGDSYQFDITLINRGGKNQTFKINNIPGWLTLSVDSGTLEPNSKMTINASVDPEFTIGDYIENLYLETDFGLDQKLQLNLRVLETEPNWSVDPNAFDFSMNIIGKLKVSGTISRDHYDKVGAFFNGIPRGETRLVYDPAYDEYFVYLTIFSNTAYGETIEFRAWDASQGKILEVDLNDVTTTTFMENEIIGTKSNAAIFENTEVVEQKLALNAGWTWVSFDVSAPDFSNLNKLTSELDLYTNDRILSLNPGRLETYFKHPTDPYKSGWSGTISANGGLTTSKMYKLKLEKENNLSIKGIKVNLDEWFYELHENWNWLPFVVGNNTPINDALAFFEPEDGDVIKSQNLFSIYDPLNGWTGTLNYLIAGNGYMIRSGKTQTFRYPRYLSTAAKGKSVLKSQSEISKEYTKYAENMNVILRLPKGYSKVMVYDTQGILRGSAENQWVEDESLSFLTIYGDIGENMRFYISNGVTEEETTKTIVFNANDVLGTVQEPIVLKVPSKIIEVYPNPFEKELKIRVVVESNQKVQLTLDAMSGQTIYQKEIDVNTGENWLSIQPEISSGSYYLKAIVNGVTVSKKVIKK